MNAAGSNNLQTFGMQTGLVFCEACSAKVNTLEDEIDFLRNLLRKNRIPIPNVTYGKMQHVYSEPLLEAYRIVDFLKS